MVSQPEAAGGSRKGRIVLIALLAAVAIFFVGRAFGWWGAKPAENLTLYGNVEIREVQLGFRLPGRIEALQGRRHLQSAVLPLHAGSGDSYLHRGPTATGVLHDVAFGVRPGRSDEPHRVREERRLPLQFGAEEAFGGQQLSPPLDAGQQFTEPDHANVAGLQRQRPARGVVGGPGLDDHTGTLDDRRVQTVEEGA